MAKMPALIPKEVEIQRLKKIWLIVIAMGSTAADFVGTNLFAWDVRSLNSTSTYSFYLVNGTDSVTLDAETTYSNSVISLDNSTTSEKLEKPLTEATETNIGLFSTS
jgi:hypothetical protein